MNMNMNKLWGVNKHKQAANSKNLNLNKTQKPNMGNLDR